jgi:hypothetical protein
MPNRSNDVKKHPLLGIPKARIPWPCGETIPKLGGVIEEDAESIKRRQKAPIAWNTKDTYTMALWSAYVDFLGSKVLNLPGICPFFLSRVLGKQCVNFTMYLIDENRGNEKHYQKDIENVVDGR